MLRVIALLLLGLALLWLVLSVARRVGHFITSATKAPSQAETKEPDPMPDDISQDLVSCAHCRVFLPMSEAVKFRGQYYCSKACLPE